MAKGRAGTRTLNPYGTLRFDVVIPPGGIAAFTYRRKSKDLKEDDVSLPEQLERTTQLITERGAIHVADAWDADAPGVDPERPGYLWILDQIRTTARSGVNVVLVVWRADRPYRGLVGGGPLFTLLEDIDQLQLASVTDAAMFTRDFLSVAAMLSEQERQAIRRRTMDMRLHRARQGKLMAGTLPYWLGRDADNRGVLIPDRAQVMVELIRRYVGGEPTRDISRWLRASAPEAGFYRGATWSADRVIKQLHNTALFGELLYGQHAYTKARHPGTGNRMRKRHRKADIDIIKIPVPPLIHCNSAELAACGGCDLDDRPTFADVTTAMAARQTKLRGRPTDQPHPLSRLVFCGVCNNMMSVHTQRRYKTRSGEQREFDTPHRYLRCRTSHGLGLQAELARDRGDARCRVPALLVADQVLGEVKAQLMRADLPAAIETAAIEWARTTEQREQPADELPGVLARLETVDRDEAQLWKDRQAGMRETVYELLRGELAVKRTTLEWRISELHKQIERDQATSQEMADAASVAEVLRAVPWDKLNDDDWAELMRGLVQGIVVDGQNHVHIKMRLSLHPHLSIEVSDHSATAIVKFTEAWARAA